MSSSDDNSTLVSNSYNSDASENEASDAESEYEPFERSKIRLIRKKTLPEIEPEYNEDTSDEETNNTVGNVPMEWYDEYPHIGYDVSGQKIMKPAKGDELDKFLSLMDDKDAWKTVYDKLEGKDVLLSKEELKMLKRIQRHQFPETEYDPFEPTVEWFTSKVEVTPLSAAPEPKRRFIPSKWEASKIMKIARAIKAGLIVPGPKAKKNNVAPVYDIWADSETTSRTHRISAPKMILPQHVESFNPPQEYLLTPEEENEWNSLDPEDRLQNFLPRKFSAMRNIPGYDRFIQERFERCLDLYLCPRMIKQKLNIDPESLIPKLPSPQELRPFPTKISIVYRGHKERIRSIAVDHTGQWLASGSDDKTVRIWEVSSGRTVKTFTFEENVMSVSWNPNPEVLLLAVASGNNISLINPSLSNQDIIDATNDMLAFTPSLSGTSSAEWSRSSEKGEGFCVNIAAAKNISSITWHRKGDYFATVCPEGLIRHNAAISSSILIHQLSKGHSQAPFKKNPGLVQKVLFHPNKPILFVATQRHVRVYNLTKQVLIKKLMPGAKWISSMDIHPGGDNLIIGTFDKRLHWFDMDLSTKPYKTLRYHKEAIRQVTYHKRYPLFASSSDDGSVLIFHGTVYNDLMLNPLIVPVKTLKAHEIIDHLGVLDIVFHPSQPWIFSSGADQTIKLFV